MGRPPCTRRWQAGAFPGAGPVLVGGYFRTWVHQADLAEGRSLSDYVLWVLSEELACPSQAEWLGEILAQPASSGLDGARAVVEARADHEEERAAAGGG
ncbi:MAG: hypothetical protein ACRD0J_02600 [Acidimicrobiales bacterium]